MTDQNPPVTQSKRVGLDLAALLSECTLKYRMRRQILQAQIRLDNQIGALERLKVGKLKGKQATVLVSPEQKLAIRLILPYLEPQVRAFTQTRKQIEKELVSAAKQLPVFAWVKQTPGLGALGLGLIVGEAGDLLNYANPAKLWKRFGLAVMGGERQRRVAGKTPAAKQLAILHGFSPRRRALLHVIGDSCIKTRRSPYRTVYDARKAYEWERLPDDKCRKGHAHMRAMRYMEKRILRDLWVAWRQTNGREANVTRWNAAVSFVAAPSEASPVVM